MKKEKHIIFYSIVGLSFLLILLSNPFLRYPYDMIHHLIVIDNFYTMIHNPIHKMIAIWVNDLYVMIPTEEVTNIVLGRPRYIWHYDWAFFFHLLQIDSTQLLLRAKIIHVIQTSISLLCLYYFSKVVLRNTFKNIEIMTLKYLSLWSVFIWLSMFATASAAYHQVWMLWYSVNYQISLPLFWYMTALTLVLFLEQTSAWKKLFFIAQIMLLSRIILQIHSMEFLYYLMYLAVFVIIYLDKVYFFVKKYFYLFIPIVFTVGYFIQHYQPEHSKIFNYLSWGKLPELYSNIMQNGALLLHGYNRASASINELIYITGIIGVPFLLYVLFQSYMKKQQNIHIRMLSFVGLTSLFVLIPLYQFTGGLFSMITYTMVVNRLYYSASIFIILPIVVYYIFQNYHLRLRYINLILMLTLVVVYIFSKHSNSLHHNYYKNIQSIKNSFHERKVGFNLSEIQITTISEHIQEYEKKSSTYKKIRYYARADIAFVIKYILKKDVYWEGRRANPDYIKIYNTNKPDSSVYPVLFEIPKNFPPYHPYR